MDLESEWLKSMAKALKVPVPARTPLPEDGLMIRLILLPSFHPWCCITLNSTPTMAALEFRRAAQGESPRKSENMLLPNARDLFFECGKWRRAKLEIPETHGMDGMTVHAVIANPMERDTYRWWSPRPDSIPHKLLARLYSLCLAHAREESTRQALERIHGYMFETLPARIIEHDDYQTLRIYDGLWMGLEDELRNVFGNLDEERPVLVDMSNFGTMGTMFYPFFQKAAARPNTAWLLSPEAMEQFDEMNFPRELRTQDRREALEKILGPAD